MDTALKRVAILTVLVAFVGTLGLYLSLRHKPSADPASAAPLDPDLISFPAVSGRAKEKLRDARSLHRAALESYLRRDRKEGDARALGALRLYEEAGVLIPALSGLHHEVLVTLAAEGALDDAVREAEAWLERFPHDRLHRETLAKLHYQAGRYGSAAAELEALASRLDGEPSLLRRAVESRLMEGSGQGAIAALRKYLASLGLPRPRGSTAAQGEEEALRLAARVHARFQEHPEALGFIDRLLEIVPADPEASLLLGASLRALGRHAEAITALAPLLDDPRHGPRALEESASSLAKEGRHAEAVRLLCRLLEREPFHGASYHQLAASLRRTGNDVAAGAMETTAVDLSRSARERARAAEHRAAGRGADAVISDALSLVIAGRFLEADQALAGSPLRRDPALALGRARIYLDWLRAAEAEAIVERLAREAGEDSEAARLLADARELQGANPTEERSPGDARALREAIARTPWPRAAPLLVELASLEAASHQKRAIGAARLACAADPKHAPAWRLLARLLDSPGEVFHRINAWKSLLGLEPQDEEARRGAALCRELIDALAGK
ncbi:MAG TPA: hypothetical protein VMT52_17960 [Planctomycetota bacterium]|nr:hypothetical protein [Planctomycetota bacterium]